MNIKEAGAYANYLNSAISLLGDVLFDKSIFTTEKEIHLRNDSFAGSDTIIEVKNELLEGYDTGIKNQNDILPLLDKLIEEKVLLATAIAKAKATMFINYKVNNEKLSLDAAIEYNKLTRNFSGIIERLLSIRPSTENRKGTAYGLNNEGNQIQLTYAIEVERKPVLDRKHITKYISKKKAQADTISQMIDKAMLLDSVVFNPKFDMYSKEITLIEDNQE